jgi:alginate O-acetyltransferase complex protein AlgI
VGLLENLYWGSYSLIFNSLKYALFLPLVLAIFWLCPFRWRIPILLLASYIFYMAWRPIYIILILGLTIINYWLGLRIWDSQKRKKAWLVTAIVANLATLAFFKYFYLLEDTFTFLAHPLFGDLPKIPVNIILPLGISFFVFEFLHYVIDVYRGSEPVRDFPTFALFPSFFPTQIAGPIKRVQDFVPQLKVPTRFSRTQFDEGCFLILNGLFKKVLLADNLALFVTGGFSNPQIFTGPDIWLFAWAFTFQVYFDFGGYTDIARGSALLFGYKIPINFDFPLLAGSISEFWRRWNITLGSWLRDYLYIPLGGSHCSKLRAAINVIITMTLCGLWHGAAFHYIVWGFYHGVALALHREFRRFRELHPKFLHFLDSRPGHIFSMFLSFNTLAVSLIIFRASSLTTAMLMMRKMFFLEGSSNLAHCFSTLQGINYPLIFPSIFLLLPAFVFGQAIIQNIATRFPVMQSPRLLKAAYATAIIFLIAAFAPDSSPRFIYYQF